MTKLSRNAKKLVIAALLGLVAPLSMRAQGNPAACAAAQDSLNAGAFLWTGVLELDQCGASGAITLASLITQSASAQLDSSQRFNRLIGLASSIISPAVANAAVSVAQGTGNTQVARVTALRVLLAEFNNAEGLVPGGPGQSPEACTLLVGGVGTDAVYNAGLPPTTLQQMMSAASALYH
ncbi:MAG: hypothetical protein ACREN6_00860, partial [Gemmatimonadaceae bacterium]